MLQPPFYDTVNLPQAELAQEKKRATKQDAMVLDIFKRYCKQMTVSDVYQKLLELNVSILKGSVGRSCTNLLNAGDLVKVKGKRKQGLFGASEGYYTLNPGVYKLKQEELFN